MNNPVPKQFLLISGKPVLHYAFEAFVHLSDVKFTLVLPENYVDYWNKLCSSSGFNIPHNIVEGGPTRFHSVKAGLSKIPYGELVLIHDAARPFPSQATINNVVSVVLRKGNAIPVIDIPDSVREVTGNFNRSIDRNIIKAIQTPQGYYSEKIKDAYNQPYNELFTDDASVLESTGEKINIVTGNPENIKISKAIDLIIAESIFNSLELIP